MARKDDIQYLTIDNFSPGITGDYRVSSASGPLPLGGVRPTQDAIKPGMAISNLRIGNQVHQTQGYYSNNEGKLVPLPYALPSFATITLQAGDTFQDVAGLQAVPAVIGGTPSDDIFAWVHVLSNTPKDTLRLYRNGTLLKSHVGALATAGPPRGITHFSSRGKRTAFGTPGGPELFYEWTSGEAHTDASVQFYEVFPDPNALTVDNTYEETGVINNAAFLLGGQILPHNGRIIRLCEQSHDFGTHKYYSNERIRNTDPPNSVSLTATTTDSVIDPQYPGTYGAWGSLTYGELLLIKQYGGAVLMEGDVYAPQITRLPGVQSTGSLMSETAWSSRGLVYMTDDGPYMWTGGSSSQRLGFPSGDIDVIPNAIRLGNSGICCSCMAWNNLVIFSGGSVWDSITDSWWALTHVPTITSQGWFAASPTLQSTFYAIDMALDTNSKIEITRFQSDAGSQSNTAIWISLPIPVTYDTIDILSVEISMGSLPVSNPQNITATVQFLDIDGNLITAANFIPDTSQSLGSVRLRSTCGVRATTILPLLTVTNSLGDLPVINSITIGYREAGSHGPVYA